MRASQMRRLNSMRSLPRVALRQQVLGGSRSFAAATPQQQKQAAGEPKAAAPSIPASFGSVEDFIQLLKDNDQHRAYFVYDKAYNKILVSHPCLQPFANAMRGEQGALARDWSQHEGLFFEVGPQTETLKGAFIHNTRRGQTLGGARLWTYDRVDDFICDGMRLSQGMSRKNALAGLWWGGGKGIVCSPKDTDKLNDPVFRRLMFREHGQFVSSLLGCYITAEDVGTTVEDIACIHERTRFVVCIPEEIGGSGNPSRATAHGVVAAMEGALDWKVAGDSLENKTIAVQGGGNVARFMIEKLLEKGARRVVCSDISQKQLDTAQKMFAGAVAGGRLVLRKTDRGDNSVLFEDADIVAPCALGGVLDAETIAQIQAPIICGAANNQLLNPEADGRLCKDSGKVYVPDFLANRMGVVHACNEQYGYVLPDDPAETRHMTRDWRYSVFKTTQGVLQKSVEENITTSLAANKLADRLCEEPHPIWKDRAATIIRHLVKEDWDKKPIISV